MRSFDPEALDVAGDEVTLRGGLCGRCERRHFPFHRACPWCGGAVSEVALPHAGTVHTHTTTHLPVAGTEPPVTIALVEHGPDMIVQGVVAGEVSIGDRVRLVPRRVDDVTAYGYEVSDA